MKRICGLLIIIAAFFVVMACISASSAAENGTTVEHSVIVDNLEIVPFVNQPVIVDNLNDNIEISQPANFNMLHDEISKSNKQLDLNKDYKFNPATDKKYKIGINITADNFIIDGHGHTIDANGQSKIFNIEGRGVTIKNINFINANSLSNGSALTIFAEARDAHVDNCSFENNTGMTGGALAWFAEEGVLENSRFNNNHAREASAGYFTCPTDIIKCNFTNNNAEIEGTIIYGITFNHENKMAFPYLGENMGLIEGCIFDHNTAMGSAGGEFYASCVIKNSKFINNHANKVGAFYAGYSCKMLVEGCDIINNTADTLCGGIASYNSLADIKNCNFINNTAQRGGALDAPYLRHLKNCNFTGNHARIGGAIHGVKIVDICDCNFNDNSADENGGAISFTPYAPGYKITSKIKNCKFNTNNTSPEGQNIFSSSVNLILEGNSFGNETQLDSIYLNDAEIL